MVIDPQYAHLVIGSKVGAGIQGEEALRAVDACFDRVLVLSPDRHVLYPDGPLGHLRERAIVRVMHWPDALRGGWSDLLDYTRHCLNIILDLHRYGVRDFITINEPNLAVEGGGDSYRDYENLNTWGVNHCNWLRTWLRERGISDVRLWGPALSPGHNEDDNFVGYRLLLDYLQQLDVLAVHFYGKDEGKDRSRLIDSPEADWYACRLNRVRPIIRELGLTQPFAITEFNHPGCVPSSPSSVERYLSQVEDYYRWANAQPDVIAACYFLATHTDPAFHDFAFSRMPGAFDRLRQFNRFETLDSVELPEQPSPAPSPGASAPPAGVLPHDWHPALADYAAQYPDFWAINVPGIDQFGIVTQDAAYRDASGTIRYGVARVNPGPHEVNGYEPQTIHWFDYQP